MNVQRPRARAPVLIPVGRFFGVPLYFTPSWVLVATLITIMYAAAIRDRLEGASTAAAYAGGAGFALALALCLLAHELGHVSVSLALGKRVRRVVIMFLAGMSEIEDEIARARDECLIAVAGPIVSALLAGILFALAPLASGSELAHLIVLLLAWSNLVLAAFNLLPGLPLDGGRMLRAAVWGATHSQRIGSRVAGWAGLALAILVAAGSVALSVRIADVATALLGVLLGVFIWAGAGQVLRVTALTDRLAVVRLPDLLRPGLFVRADTPLGEALRRTREVGARGIVVLDGAERPQAIVDEAAARRVSDERLAWTPVAQVARPIEPGMILPDTLSADELIGAIRRTPASEYLVVHADGGPAGILAAADLATVLSARRR
ncbi:MAG: M50 family metallopeptidase [Actinobacteria bacterium]|nr:M50 family metallopeptidase [Actinomycetota bacterium]